MNVPLNYLGLEVYARLFNWAYFDWLRGYGQKKDDVSLC